MTTIAVIRLPPLRLDIELARLLTDGVVTVRLPCVGEVFLDCCTVGLTETLRVCGGGWIIGCGSRLLAVTGGLGVPDERAGDDGVTRVG